MSRISQTTARTISPIINGMAQAGTLPKAEANAAVLILREACKPEDTTPIKHKPTMLTTAQAALRLGICTKTVLRMYWDGQLRGVKLTGSRKSLRFPETEIERLVSDEV